MTGYYRDAMKKGQREFRSCVYRGEYPYLPRLDEFVPAEQLAHGIDLGLVQVPLELIVGTRSGGRTQAFSRSFLPILPEDSEFAGKWDRLCAVHLEEGIRDPIKAYEYMHRFYVEEGNKRVSVLKSFGAADIAAYVTRILPQRNGSREVEQYDAFLEFWKDSRLYLIECSRPEGYRKLQRLMGREPGEAWTDEERSRFVRVYYAFRKAFEARGGERGPAAVGDAFVDWIGIYGYGEVIGKSEEEIRKLVSLAWEEIAGPREETTVELSPEKEKGGALRSKVSQIVGVKVLHVAFIHDKGPDLSGWTYGHELGRLHLDRMSHGTLETAAYFDACTGDPRQVLECAIEDGNTVLFTTSPRLLDAGLRTAVEHPEVTVLNCSLDSSHRAIRTYYARMYEVKFILGAIAGALAEGTDAGPEAIGYLCDYPIFGQVAGINAFALGVQMTSPSARVFLDWSSVGGVDAATARLTGRGARLISTQDLAKRDARGQSYGLSLITDNGAVVLATPQWRWGTYYDRLLRQIRERPFRAERREGGRAVSYFWGLREGVVDLVCSEKLPHSTRRLAVLLREAIRSGFCDPFRGPLFSQSGRRMEDEHRSPGMEEIIRMDWLNENIVGSIPAYADLDDTGKATVDVVGVGPSTKGEGTRP